jgi:hypothetical protein
MDDTVIQFTIHHHDHRDNLLLSLHSIAHWITNF